MGLKQTPPHCWLGCIWEHCARHRDRELAKSPVPQSAATKSEKTTPSPQSRLKISYPIFLILHRFLHCTMPASLLCHFLWGEQHSTASSLAENWIFFYTDVYSAWAAAILKMAQPYPRMLEENEDTNVDTKDFLKPEKGMIIMHSRSPPPPNSYSDPTDKWAARGMCPVTLVVFVEGRSILFCIYTF